MPLQPGNRVPKRPLVAFPGGSILRWIIRGAVSLSAVGEMFNQRRRSEEHTSELQSLMRISYAVLCLKKKKKIKIFKNILTKYQHLTIHPYLTRYTTTIYHL